MATDVNSSNLRIESLLREGELKVTARLVNASNATLKAKIDTGTETFDCIYKPVAGERPLWDFSDGTLAQREFAAYLLSQACGFDVVPPTVLRQGPFGEGAVQLWIEINDTIDMIEFFQCDHLALRNMALFDAVINNTDRKIGHILPDRLGNVYGCDHGVSFHADDKLRTVLWQWAGSAFLPEERMILERARQYLDSSSELGQLITPLEIKAAINRIDRLMSTGAFPNPSKDWPAVPWPPY